MSNYGSRMDEDVLSLHKRRTIDVDYRLYNWDGSGAAIDANDKVRWKLGSSLNAVPSLDLDNISATASGSVVTIVSASAPAHVRVRVAQGDMAGVATGEYYTELLLVDTSESSPANAAKLISTGRAIVYDTMLGDIGAT